MFRSKRRMAGPEGSVDSVKEGLGAETDELCSDDGPEDAGEWQRPAETHEASAAPEIQKRALLQMESMLEKVRLRRVGAATAAEGEESPPRKLAEEKWELLALCKRVGDSLDWVGSEARRLQGEVSRLTAVADQLQKEADEPRFRPGAQPVDIVLAGIPDFEGLIGAQRALSCLPAAKRASVVSYQQGEASLEVLLQAPVSASQIVGGLRERTGHELLIEQSLPQALRLRLRFVGRNGHSSGANADETDL